MTMRQYYKQNPCELLVYLPYLLALILIWTVPVPANAQDKQAQIANLTNQISQLENETPGFETRLAALKTERENQIDFVGQAYDKQMANYSKQVDDYNAQNADLIHQQELLKPALENYQQRVNQHNANRCTEKCTNGSCDGSCQWYTNEKNQLDANKAQLEAAVVPLDARAATLHQTRQFLETTGGQLTTIKTNLDNEVTSFKAKVAQLEADWQAHEEKLNSLRRQLARLQFDSVDSCLKAIPPACENPAIGPDGKPILDQKCEIMHATCGKMFDGN